MIEQIEQPECFSDQPDGEGVVFYRGSLNGETYAYAMTREINDTDALFHTFYYNWTKSIMQTSKNDFEVIKANLMLRGIGTIIAVNPACGDLRWGKFINVFGFQPPEIVQASKMEL